MSQNANRLTRKQRRANNRDNHEEKRDSNVVNIRDADARTKGPDKKHWTHHDLVAFKAEGNQAIAVEAYANGDDLGLYGAAGAGKTLLATYLACSSMVDPAQEIDGILVVRSAVPGREIGFVPGTEEEKLAMYEEPYESAFGFVFGAMTSYKHLKAAGKVQFTSTTAKRGVNWQNKVIIVEEVQNMTFHEIDTLMTRRHDNCRIILTGDSRQPDLKRNEVSGLPTLQRVSPDLHGMSMVTFTWADCRRGKRVMSWLKATANINPQTGE